MRVIVLLALMGSAFAVPRSITRIVGGSATTVERYPYMANMQFGSTTTWFSQACGGSLLTTTAVLSAAHCYDGAFASRWRVRLGTSLRSGGGSLHTISRIIIHEQYNNPRSDNDVAIVHLNTPAVFSDVIKAGRIAGNNYHLSDGTTVTAIGWGDLEFQGSPPEQLQHVNIRIINQDTCAERYAYLKSQPGFELWPDVSPSMICAGILDVGGKDACQGDSGGPVIFSQKDGDVIIGVTSWGYKCAEPFYPGVSARVSYYSDWIVSNSV